MRFALYAFLHPHDECLQKDENVEVVSIFMPIGKKKHPKENASKGESQGKCRRKCMGSAGASTNGEHRIVQKLPSEKKAYGERKPNGTCCT